MAEFKEIVQKNQNDTSKGIVESVYSYLLEMAEKLQKQDYSDIEEDEKTLVQDSKLRDQSLIKDILRVISDTLPEVKMHQSYTFMKTYLSLLGHKIDEIPEDVILKVLNYFMKMIDIDDEIPEDSEHNTPHESPISEPPKIQTRTRAMKSKAVEKKQPIEVVEN